MSKRRMIRLIPTVWRQAVGPGGWIVIWAGQIMTSEGKQATYRRIRQDGDEPPLPVRFAPYTSAGLDVLAEQLLRDEKQAYRR
jgi:hypothetical protein